MTRRKLSGFAVYRLFDASGSLLYVGSSGDAEGRIKRHRTTQPWRAEIATWTVETGFSSTGQMLYAKRTAIKTEHPRYNRMCAVTVKP